MITKLIKLFISVLLIPLVMAFVIEGVALFKETITFDAIKWVLGGLVGYFFLFLALSGSNLDFFQVFEHESGHMVMLLAFSNDISEFWVTPTEGQVETPDQPPLAWVVYLAPYYLPVFTLPLLLALPFVSATLSPFVEVAIGLTLGFHYFRVLSQFSSQQSDIQANTTFFSLLVVILFNLWVFVFVLSVVVGDLWLLVDYFAASLERSAVYYAQIITWLGTTGILAF